MTLAAPGTTRELAVQNGLEFLELEPSRYAQFLEGDSRLGLLHRLRHLQGRRTEALQSLGLEPFVQAVRDLEPDLVLLDLNLLLELVYRLVDPRLAHFLDALQCEAKAPHDLTSSGRTGRPHRYLRGVPMRPLAPIVRLPAQWR